MRGEEGQGRREDVATSPAAHAGLVDTRATGVALEDLSEPGDG